MEARPSPLQQKGQSMLQSIDNSKRVYGPFLEASFGSAGQIADKRRQNTFDDYPGQAIHNHRHHTEHQSLNEQQSQMRIREMHIRSQVHISHGKSLEDTLERSIQHRQSSNKITSATTKKFSSQDRVLDVSKILMREKSLRHLRKKQNVHLSTMKKVSSI